MKDRATGRSRGFGFVTYASDREAMSALENMNEVELVRRVTQKSVYANTLHRMAEEYASIMPTRMQRGDTELGLGLERRILG